MKLEKWDYLVSETIPRVRYWRITHPRWYAVFEQVQAALFRTEIQDKDMVRHNSTYTTILTLFTLQSVHEVKVCLYEHIPTKYISMETSMFEIVPETSF